MDWPEHEKLKAIQHKSQVCGAFIEWLQGEGFFLEHTDGKHFNLQDSLAKFFNIDQRKLEDEKVAMLDAIRKERAARTQQREGTA